MASLALSSMAGAATFFVNSTNDEQDANPGNGICASSSATCTLRAAITEANALAGPDVIRLPAGTFTLTRAGVDDTNANGDLDVTSEMLILGTGNAGNTFVEAAPTPGTAVERVFHLLSALPVTLGDFTVRNGRQTTPGVLATLGSGIRIEPAGAVTTLNAVTLSNNENAFAGAGLAVIGANAVTTLNNCRVENNRTQSTGQVVAGGIQINSATATTNINGSTITGNLVSSTSPTITIGGGGISSAGTLNITNSVVSNNTATSTGIGAYAGGILAGGATTIIGSTISGNASTVTAGTGVGRAGGIYNQGGTMVITDSVVSGNTATGEGGGLVNFSITAANSTMTITGSTVSGNSATGATSTGGGLLNFSNAAGLAVVNVNNSTISGNSSTSAAGSSNTGATSSINYNYATVVSNIASTNGGGVLQNATGTTRLKNSIVADNNAATGPDIAGTLTSQGYNHVENTSGATFTAISGDITGTDPQLWALANNGGVTLTHLPASSSPVIDSIPNGTSDCGVAVVTSQNGVARPYATGCEKGAAEVGEAPVFRNGFDGV